MSDALEAILWDMDGVIADTAQYHYGAWQVVFGKRGASFPYTEFMRHFGMRNDTIIKDTLGYDISAEDLNAVATEKEATYRRLVADNIKALPGAIELLKSLKKAGIKMAIASSAPLENIDIIIKGLGIDKLFGAIAWGREVTESKPSPQIFLLAARKLGIKPENCVVIEDAVAGVTAAKNAGMKCLAVTNSHPENSLKNADLIVDTLEAVDINRLAGLFRDVKQET